MKASYNSVIGWDWTRDLNLLKIARSILRLTHTAIRWRNKNVITYTDDFFFLFLLFNCLFKYTFSNIWSVDLYILKIWINKKRVSAITLRKSTKYGNLVKSAVAVMYCNVVYYNICRSFYKSTISLSEKLIYSTKLHL